MSSSVVSTQHKYIQRNAQLRGKIPLGQLLIEAGFISEEQLNLALQNQSTPGYEDLKIGEILSLRGWTNQETCDFFADRWEGILNSLNVKDKHKKIGYYLLEAGLLTEAQVTTILKLQQQRQGLFGQIAVAEGYVKPQTIEFFMKYLSSSTRAQTLQKVSLERAERYFKLNDVQGAILEFRGVLRNDANNAKAHAWLTKIYLGQGQLSLAKVHLKKAIALAPDDGFVKETKKLFFGSVPSSSQVSKNNQRPKEKSPQRSSWLRFG